MNAGPFYSSGSSTSDLKDKILLVPSVSLANLPQLAVDLLIASLQLDRVGFVGVGDTVAPLLGYSDGAGTVTGGLELYGKAGSELVVLQQRSPTLKNRKDQHVELLRNFISSSGFRAVIILSSLDAANQDDAQLQTPHQVILPPGSTLLPAALQTLASLPPLSFAIELPSQHSHQSPEATKTGPYPPFIPGGGLSRRLLSVLTPSSSAAGGGAGEGVSKSTSNSSSSSSTWVQIDQPTLSSGRPSGSNTSQHSPHPIVPPHLTVVAWCVEGDNRPDAHALASLLLQALTSDEVEIVEPDSWKGLFGGPGWSGGYGQDAELYG